MKKIFTLLFAVGCLTAIQAQPGSRDNRDSRDTRDKPQNDRYGKDVGINNGRYDNDDRYNNNNGTYERNLRMQIAQLNRKYDLRIQKVRNDFFMRRAEKMRVIRSLEAQRQQEIRTLHARSKKMGQHNRGYDSRRRY